MEASADGITLPPIEDLPSLSETEKINVINALFEPCNATCTNVLPVLSASHYNTYNSLIDACQVKFQELASQASGNVSLDLYAIIGSHPRLGARKVDSVQSAAEQANLAGEREDLAKLNEVYEATFPGLRYVVFVNGRGRPEIMADMKERIAQADFDKEVKEALNAMCLIAKDRAQKLSHVRP